MPVEFKRAKDLFLAAVEHASPTQRDAYLAAACGADADLRQYVAALLRRHEQPPSRRKPALGGKR